MKSKEVLEETKITIGCLFDKMIYNPNDWHITFIEWKDINSKKVILCQFNDDWYLKHKEELFNKIVDFFEVSVGIINRIEVYLKNDK